MLMLPVTIGGNQLSGAEVIYKLHGALCAPFFGNIKHAFPRGDHMEEKKHHRESFLFAMLFRPCNRIDFHLFFVFLSSNWDLTIIYLFIDIYRSNV